MLPCEGASSAWKPGIVPNITGSEMEQRERESQWEEAAAAWLIELKSDNVKQLLCPCTAIAQPPRGDRATHIID